MAKRFLPHLCGEHELHIAEPCNIPYFTGLDDVTVVQGTDFDLRDGVSAFDGDGNPVPFTVDPAEFASCTLGEQIYTYWIGDYHKDRKITVIQADDPVIYGLDRETVVVGEDFNPLDGVSAFDAVGHRLTVMYELAPTLTRGRMLMTTAKRSASDPVISGPTEPLTVQAGIEFDPIEGMSALDSRGFTIPVHAELRGDGSNDIR